MANTLTAEVTLYGTSENREAMIDDLHTHCSIDLTTEWEDDNFSQHMEDFRWNLEILISDTVKELCVKHDVALEAHGVEPGFNFFQCVSVDREGSSTDQSIELPDVSFDPDTIQGRRLKNGKYLG